VDEIDFRMAIINGHRNGIATNEIARITGYARSTCQRWVNRYKNKEIRFRHIPEHPHHFIIDSPNGPISRGVCKICLEVKSHYNSATIWDKKTTKERQQFRFNSAL